MERIRSHVERVDPGRAGMPIPGAAGWAVAGSLNFLARAGAHSRIISTRLPLEVRLRGASTSIGRMLRGATISSSTMSRSVWQYRRNSSIRSARPQLSGFGAQVVLVTNP